MSDSIQNVIRTIEKTSNDGIDLINKVDSFYNSAWDKLIMMGTVAFAIVGIVVPLIIQWYQKKSLKISEELLKKEIENQVSKIKQEILVDISNILDSKFQVYEQKIENLAAAANAKSFHIQGNFYCSIGDFSKGLSDYITAAYNYLICEDFNNLQIINNNISDICFKKLTYVEIMNLKITHDSDIEVLINEISKRNEKGIFSPMINGLRLKLNNLKQAINGKPVATENS